MDGLINDNGFNGNALNNGVNHAGHEIPLPEPIAIVGMALRLPGKIHSPEALWQLLMNKETTRGPTPISRYNSNGFYSPTNKPGTVGVRYGHFLDEADGLDLLDTSFFSMAKSEVEKLDPQQRMLLEVVWECMENGGQQNWRGSNTGVFVGTWGDDWQDFLAKDPQQHGGMLNVSGAGDFAISNRISYEYDLHGPSMTIKSACASAMICLHEASQALRNNECTAAVVAGTNLILTPTQTIAQSEAGVLSPTGECRTFDSSANGYARGEAINALLVKKLSDAIRDSDVIRAVVRSTAVNCDGRSAGLSTPNPEAHVRMIKRAYEVGGLKDPSDTPYVEVHGTGTPTGDPLELEAIAKVFGDDRDTYVGSVKANVGHGEGASGNTSLIKAVLALENRTIPPQVNFSIPNPKIPFKKFRLVVPLSPVPWPDNRPERISVNSFGITGANAHAIIESAASYGVQNQKKLTADAMRKETDSHLLVISATNAESLKTRWASIQSYIATHPQAIRDLAHTLANKRDHLAHKAYCITDGRGLGELASMEKFKQVPTMNFVFTGQGAQWPSMGKELFESIPSFRYDILYMAEVLTKIPHPPPWNLVDELMKEGPKSRLDKAEFAQPLCTAIQVALVNFLKVLGVTPSAVVGHSSGEIASAFAAGAVTIEEAITVAYYRGLVASKSTRRGAMAAIGLGRAEVNLYLEDGVMIACENSPNSVTLSGDEESLDRVIEQMRYDDPDIFARRLKTDGMAYHSHHMLDIGEIYEDYIGTLLTVQQPKVNFFSSVTGKLANNSSLLDAKYWRQNLESPVRFFTAVRSMIENQNSDQLFLEIGPHSALAGPLRQIFKVSASKVRLSYCSSLIRGKDSMGSILDMFGQLYLHGIPLDFGNLTPGGCTLTDLPNYPWLHNVSHWSENRVIRDWRLREFPPHELLGSRIVEGNDVEPTWRNLLRLKDSLWLQDHKVLGDVVFPCAGYIAIAGEAIRQLTGTSDFSLRRLGIETALVLQDKAVELMTSLRHPKKLNRAHSGWYEFSIISYNGMSWTEHCFGEVKRGAEDSWQSFEAPDMKALPRAVQSPYESFRSIGLHYGPAFQGLRGVSAKPGKKTAMASLQPPPITGSTYPVHPTTIDQCLQLLGMASSEGLYRHLKRIPLPTSIGQLYVQAIQSQDVLQARAIANSTNLAGDVHGEMMVVQGGKVLLSVTDCHLSAFDENSEPECDDPIAAARLSWRPDIDFLPLETLMVSQEKSAADIQLIEKYGFLCSYEIQQRTKECRALSWYFEKFKRWIDNHVEEGRLGQNKMVLDSRKLLDLNVHDRMALIEGLKAQLKTSQFVHVAELITRLTDSCVGVFEETTEILDIYIRDDGLTKLYGITGDRIDASEFFVAIGHTNPTLRVLEIGAGTGGTTQVALDALTSIKKEPMYSRYTFTDISSGFFTAASERFVNYPGIEFKTLDVSRDPAEQGFEMGTYDLIIASNVIHATNHLKTTLRNVRRLLHPRGRFFLQELTPAAAKMINIIMGPLPGWWLGEADGRANEPIVSTDRWNRELLEAGFSGIECAVHDDPNLDASIGVNIIARPSRKDSEYLSVTLLIQRSQLEADSFKLMHQKIRTQGYHVDVCLLGDVLPPYQDIVSLVEVEESFFDQVSAEKFELFQQLIACLGSSRLLWVAGSSQMGPQDPEFSLTLGLIRSIRAELNVPFAVVETDTFDIITSDTVLKILEKFQDTASSANPECEFAIKKGTVYVGRYHWAKVSEELSSFNDVTGHALRLEPSKKGTSGLSTWVPEPQRPAGPEEVVVNLKYIGLNLEDSFTNNSSSSHESSGVVLEAGSNVQGLKIGDRIAVLGQQRLSTTLTCMGNNVRKIPDNLSLENAATMPLAYATAIHCLEHLSCLRLGQTVLITSACSDVGLAAIQVFQKMGVEIYCCVSGEQQAKYLATALQLPPERIFSSQNASFLPKFMKVTNDRGADVVINTLQGELMQAAWKCVATHGKVRICPKCELHVQADFLRQMIELGNRNLLSGTQLDMSFFTGNRSLCHVDIATLQDLYPSLLGQIFSMYEQGHITPIRPVKVFETEGINDANRLLSTDEVIGKILVKMPTDLKSVRTQSISPPVQFRGNACYLIAGGVGGLGRAISTCMVEHGARNFIYLSRSAGSIQSHKDFFVELEAQGCTVQAIAGDISNPADVLKAVQAATAPIAGVLHMAMVLQDRPFLSMSHGDWLAAIKPKVAGTINLHTALLNAHIDLDFFVMFGSISGSFGIAHQANYAAGNTFQDAFVQYRHSLGLPASVLNIGAMAEVGYVSQNKVVQEYFRNAGMPFLSEEQLFESLHLSILQQYGEHRTSPAGADPGFTSISQLALGIRTTKAMTDPSNRVLWKGDRRVDIYRNIEAASNIASASLSGTATSDKVSAFMASINSSSDPLSLLQAPENVTLLASEIGIFIYDSMLQSVDEDEIELDRNLTTLGVDSLVTIEVRNWMRRKLEVEVSTLEMLNGGSIRNLATLVQSRLMERYAMNGGE